MVSNAGGTPAEGREERVKSAGKKWLLRMKTALRKTDSAKQMAIPAVTAANVPPEPAAGPSTRPPVATATTETAPCMKVSTGSAHLHHSDDTFEGQRIPRAQFYAERAKKLSERYGLDMDPQAWYQMEGHVLRVNKSIRMRVHRICHQCGHGLDNSGSCGSCKHSACSQCTCYPPKRSEAEKAASRENREQILQERTEHAVIMPDWNFKSNDKVVISKPGRASGQELVYKKVRQRVRRTCCQCLEAEGLETCFQGGKLICPKCNHARCTDCPRDPPKKDKYPYGYPGDEFGGKSIAYYKCHQCNAKFPPGVKEGEPCFRCSHEKCDACERIRPHKVDPDPDPEVLRSVKERLADMKFA